MKRTRQRCFENYKPLNRRTRAAMNHVAECRPLRVPSRIYPETTDIFMVMRANFKAIQPAAISEAGLP